VRWWEQLLVQKYVRGCACMRLCVGVRDDRHGAAWQTGAGGFGSTCLPRCVPGGSRKLAEATTQVPNVLNPALACFTAPRDTWHDRGACTSAWGSAEQQPTPCQQHTVNDDAPSWELGFACSLWWSMIWKLVLYDCRTSDTRAWMLCSWVSEGKPHTRQ
jgi:hypothetical protein